MALGTCMGCGRPLESHQNMCADCDREMQEREHQEREREEWERHQMEEHFRRYPHG